MHCLCLIIEMLNKYLQMADPSYAGQTHEIVIDEASVNVNRKEIAVIVSVCWLSRISYKYIKQTVYLRTKMKFD